ncbi:MAG TPA: GNAT family N-acetyltransferase [Thermomicrobiaceae bacterium]|nr:GNAT family N-acetyltransferase [Thermomicrobiaceae bacterium]
MKTLTGGVDLRLARPEDAPACVAILRALPDWFGIEASIQHYASEIPALSTCLAVGDDRVLGFLTLKRHFADSGEIYVLGIRPEFHGRGAGTALVRWAEDTLRAEGRRYLQVKTLGPSHPSTHYARTRAFYRARGFAPLEELPDIWPGNPCLIMVKCLSAV